VLFDSVLKLLSSYVDILSPNPIMLILSCTDKKLPTKLMDAEQIHKCEEVTPATGMVRLIAFGEYAVVFVVIRAYASPAQNVFSSATSLFILYASS